MLNSRHVLLILSLGMFDISNLETVLSGFENDKTCLAIKKHTSHTAVFVKKNSDSVVVSWNFKNQKWETTIGNLYKEKIFAYTTAKKFEFCFFNTSKTDSGPYDWKDIDGNTHKMVVKVWYGPKDIIITPTVEKFLTLDKNQQFTINCSAECNPECNIIWIKGRDTFITNSTYSSSLFLNNVSINDSGDYTCLAENPKNNSYRMSKRFRFSVQYAARINQIFQTENEVKEYSNKNISCRVDSYPLSNISWSRENKTINTTFSVENEVLLYFENTTCDDTGVYKCSAFNGIGQIDTKQSMLNVLCKPRFITNYFGITIEKRVTKSIGEKIEMNVSVEGNPTPQIVYNDFEIQTEFVETSNTKYDVFIKKLVSSEYDFRHHTLIIGNSQGNVTIIIEAERKRRISAIVYWYVIGTPCTVLILISILVLIFTTVQRRKRDKDNQANSNSANNNDTGGYRDNILYHSIDSVPLEARDNNFDASDSDSFDVSSSIQNLNESPEEDKKESNKMTADTNITLNITEDKIKGRKPVPVPRKTKPYAGNFNKVQQPRMQETSNFRKDTLAKKQPTRLAVTSNKNRTLSLNSDDDSNFSLSNEKQFEPSHDNYRNHVLNEFAATSAYNAVKRNKEDVLLMYPYKGSENPVKYPGSISNYLQTYIEQDTKQHKPRTHIIKPFSINIEVACESNKIPQQGDELTESEQFSENADSCQFDDYMNI